MLIKKLIIKDGLAYEEDSDILFTGDSSELVTENELMETATYNNGKLKHVHLYDIYGTQIKNIVIQRLDGEGNLQTNQYINGFLLPSQTEEYDFKSLVIKFFLLKHIASCEISSARTLLKEFRDNSMENLKNEVREFLKNSENIRKIIEENHVRFLKEKGISISETLGTFYPNDKRKKRTTHCYDCKDPLNSFDDLSCKACKWILCSCGACGCGFERYQ